ncbi:MAG: 1-acyl-sn-glycerol-3-phosphate acyltransferase [Candidatus Pacearchaeota archaeon]|jgi:hypothetical protein
MDKASAYNLKRNPIIYSLGRGLTDLILLSYHNINIKGIENIPKKGPALILAKHQFNMDIPAEGYILNKYLQRPGNWIMKSTIPSFLEKVGGIGITRLKDVKIIKNKEKRRGYLEKAKEKNKDTTEYMTWLYQQGELIVLHPEGTRNPYRMGVINMPLISHTQKLQTELGIKIPLIMLGIEYENKKRFRSNVNINIKSLDWKQENLEGTIYTELAKLSNIKIA